MNRRWIESLILGSVFAFGAGITAAQEPPPPPPGPGAGVFLSGDSEGNVMFGFGERMELLGFGGMHGGKVVTGAPFSAVAVSETTQTLGDGNHINRKTQSNLFRDSQGRIRREMTFAGFGPMTASGQSKSFVIINDPVAGETFMLHPDQKTAEQLGKPFAHMREGMGAAIKDKMSAHQEREMAEGSLKKESLGTQTIGGIVAQGTRVTKTIPAGQIGNEKPITVIHESWYSNDLQIVVMSKQSNPWSGETTYTLTNIQRTEPDASLFAVPSDYTVTQGPGRRGMMMRHHEAAPPQPPESPEEN